MLQKTIIQGRIEYGTEKSYNMALKMYIQRAEKYYKNDVLFEPEEIFFEDSLLLSIPRFVKQVYPKTLRNTSTLLAYVVQFGLSGELNLWALDEGKILLYNQMEPNSDKVAVQQYIKGKSLVDQKGKEEEAIAALNKAIEKYDRHAQAYERRAKVNFMLKKEHDALRDYDKSIGLDPSNPYTYLGKAEVYISKKEYQEAVECLQMTIKKSVALQSVHWQGRRLKGKLHLKLKQYKEAEFELKLFTKREFPEDNPNVKWKRDAFFDYGQTQLELEDYSGAVESFQKMMDITSGNDKISKAKQLRFRGIAKQKAGQNGYKSDLKAAAEAGDKVAIKLLKA